MEIIPLTASLREEWDSVVATSDDAWFFHRYDWMTEVSERVWGYASKSFLIREGGRIVGICPLFLRERRFGPVMSWRFLSTGGFGIAGPACISEFDPAQRRARLLTMFAEIDRIAEATRAVHIEVRLPSLAPMTIASQHMPPLPFFDFGFRDHSTHTYLISLHGRNVENLWHTLAKECRNKIRKAQRNEITVHAVDAAASLDEYYTLHCTTYVRTGTPPHPRAYFETISRYRWSQRFVAERRGRIIAALNVMAYKRGVLSWTSASNATALALGANNLLRWHAIQWALTQGYDWYEVGEAFQNPTNAKQAGLTKFKGSFGGVLHPFHQYMKVYRPSCHRSYIFFQHARRLVARAANVV